MDSLPAPLFAKLQYEIEAWLIDELREISTLPSLYDQVHETVKLVKTVKQKQELSFRFSRKLQDHPLLQFALTNSKDDFVIVLTASLNLAREMLREQLQSDS